MRFHHILGRRPKNDFLANGDILDIYVFAMPFDGIAVPLDSFVGLNFSVNASFVDRQLAHRKFALAMFLEKLNRCFHIRREDNLVSQLG